MKELGFSHFAQLRPGAVAVIGPDGTLSSRADLFALVNRISRAFRNSGVGAADVVAIISPNCIEYLACYLAVTQIGAYIVPLNWHLSHSEMLHILNDCAAKSIVVHERLADLVREVINAMQVPALTLFSIGETTGFIPLRQHIEGLPSDAIECAAVGRVMMYTSATTGQPKAIGLPLNDAEAALERTIRYHVAVGVYPESDNVHLCASMLYHSAPLEGAVIALHMGHAVVLVDRWEPEAFLQLVQQYRITTTFMVPTMFVRLVKLPAPVRERYNVGTLRHVVHAAAPCAPEVKRSIIEWWGPIIWESYGASEGAGTIVNSRDWLEHPGTVGRPIPGSAVKILDDDGLELPSGQVGTIYMTRYTGDRFFYRGDPDKTVAAYKGEFFTAGDVGYLNGDGYLFVCDRKVDMIISGGMNIYSAEIERVLVQHPSVADCAVFGIPDDIMGEAVKAAVQLVPHVEPRAETTADILRFLGQRLAQVKVPRRLEYIAQLPRDPNGKLFKRRLRDPHWVGYTRKI